MPTAAAPEKAIANSRKFRVSSGLSSIGYKYPMHGGQGHSHDSQIPYEVCMRPVFCDDREYGQHRNREQVVVEHRIPVREPGHFDAFAHRENLWGNRH